MLSLNPTETIHYHFIDSLVYYYGSLCYIYLSFWKLQFVINNARLLKTKCYGNITISVKRTNAHKDSLKMRNIAYIIASFLRITVTTNMQVAKWVISKSLRYKPIINCSTLSFVGKCSFVTQLGHSVIRAIAVAAAAKKSRSNWLKTCYKPIRARIWAHIFLILL